MADTVQPSYARRTVLAAADMLKALGHTGFDRFLLELDLPDDDIGKGSGLLARATSLANFAIKNAGHLTPERRTVADEIVRRATELWQQGVSSNLHGTERETFAAAMQQEGQPLAPNKKQRSLFGGQEDEHGGIDASTGWSEPGVEKVRETMMRVSIPVDPASRKVFIVHGHDGEVRETVARFIGQLGLTPIILHEQPNRGRTIITKFREEAADIGFAIVLMTPDDHGGKAGGTTRPRARQNVVFELGFFIGALGPEKVAALVKGDVERPSDFDGVVYIPLDQGEWKIDLAKELRAAGFGVDFNKVIGA